MFDYDMWLNDVPERQIQEEPKWVNRPTHFQYIQDEAATIDDVTNCLVELVCGFITDRKCDHDCQSCCGNTIREFLGERHF